MANLNRTCIICHKKYSYCPTCAADAYKPTWMAIFCSENCKKLYDVINDYQHKLLSKEEAFKKLSLLNLSVANELPDNFKELLNEIMNAESNSKQIESKETVTEDSIEVQNKEVVVAESAIESVTEPIQKTESVRTKKKTSSRK